MSTHKVEVVQLGDIEKHPNADTLGITKVFGYTAIVRLADWNPGDLAVYVEPDYVVDGSEPVFSFLGEGLHRIKCKRLRGVWSQGLLVPAPEGSAPGDNVMGYLGITRYEPPADKVMRIADPGSCASVCDELRGLPKYDLENLRRYAGVFTPGEKVYWSEKLHGANARYSCVDGQMWAGSRTLWRKLDVHSWWTAAMARCPWIEEWCRSNPGKVLYGEIIGTQDLRYGLPNGEVDFRAFDIRNPDFSFMDVDDFVKELDADKRCYGEYTEFDLPALEDISRSNSWLYPKHVAEGIVVRPLVERVDRSVGRVSLKLVSDRYLERSK